MSVITDVDVQYRCVQVAFSVRGSLVDADIYEVTHYFSINGNHCSRSQFPLQNSFALTVHKTQELTLLKVSLSLDENIFASSQAYVALSRCSTWENIEISHLDRSVFMTDPNVISEYQRLTDISNMNSHLFS